MPDCGKTAISGSEIFGNRLKRHVFRFEQFLCNKKPNLDQYSTETACMPEHAFSVCQQDFSGQKRMNFSGRTVKQKSCRKKPKLDQYSDFFTDTIFLFSVRKTGRQLGSVCINSSTIVNYCFRSVDYNKNRIENNR